MSKYDGINNSNNNDIKTKFLKTLVSEQSTLSSNDDFNKRTKFLIRAVIGEYTCSTIFFTIIFGTLVNGYINKYDSTLLQLIISLVLSFTAISMIYTFSEISGAVFNPAISLALWLTGKLSNRKLLLYILFQLLGGLTAMFIVWCSFESTPNLYRSLLRSPVGNDNGRIFASEFFATFTLTYTIFVVILEDAESQKKDVTTFKYADGLTVYNTKGGKNAFAPFVIGFILFGLVNMGGCSGNCMNPVIVFIPALLTGASTAAAIVHFQHIKVDEKIERPTLLADDFKDDIGSPLIT